jgi:rRNA maturation endonuclease Nob1
MKKQIEEMAVENLVAFLWHNTNMYDEDLIFDVAEALCNADYRKQIEGEWKKVSEKYPRYVCTACNHLYNNKGYKYCPNCGAKMKGADNGKDV